MENPVGNAPQSVGRSFRLVFPCFIILLHFVLHSRKGEGHVLALDPEKVLPRRLSAQRIQVLSRWEGQSQKLAGAVNKLPGGNIRGSMIAAVILTLLPEMLRSLNNYRMLIYAVVLIAMMLLTSSPKAIEVRERIFSSFRKKKTEGEA